LIGINEGSAAYFWFAGIAVLLVLCSVLLTVKVGPGAQGAGVVELIGLLNGVNYPDAIGFKTLFVKIFATIFAVSGGLCLANEGPMIHTGAIVGVATCFLPFERFKFL
jgi:H+/Cl- antiporter ClcA